MAKHRLGKLVGARRGHVVGHLLVELRAEHLFALAAVGAGPPLGWLLSERSRARMDRDLLAPLPAGAPPWRPDNGATLRRVLDLLGDRKQ